VKVSALLISFNQERTIAQAIKGVLDQQTKFEFELVIGDDCSTDSTPEIIRSYAKEFPNRIRVLPREQNMGDKGARNFADAYLNCKGKYVALLEGDDYWTCPEKLQRQVEALDQHPDWAICFHNVRRLYVDTENPATEFPGAEHPEVSTIEDLLKDNFIQTCSIVVRNEIIKEFPDWYFLPGPGDWFFSLLNAQRGHIGYLPEVMATYRVHANGIWTGRDRDLASKEQAAKFRVLAANLWWKPHRKSALTTASKLTLDRALISSERGHRFDTFKHAMRSVFEHPVHPSVFSRERCAILCRALAPKLFEWLKEKIESRRSQPSNSVELATHTQPCSSESPAEEIEKV